MRTRKSHDSSCKRFKANRTNRILLCGNSCIACGFAESDSHLQLGRDWSGEGLQSLLHSNSFRECAWWIGFDHSCRGGGGGVGGGGARCGAGLAVVGGDCVILKLNHAV